MSSKGKYAELFTVGQFTVTPVGLRWKGTPEMDQWEVVGPTLTRMRDGIQWAIGDWLNYGDEHYADEGRYEAAAELTGLKRGYLQNLKSISRTFAITKRFQDLSWSHHALVAGFSEDVRDQMLRRAITEDLSWEALRVVARDARHLLRISQRDWPEGTYGLLLVDPPWEHEEGALPPTRQTENHYPVMSDDAIMALAPKVQAISAPDVVVYCWATNVKAYTGAAARILSGWGFDTRSGHVWVKDLLGLGYWVRNRHEQLIIATRGNPVPPPEDLRPDSVIQAPRREHSVKPVEAYEMLERCYEGVPKVELFARGEPRAGWTAWGNQLEEAEAPAPRRQVRVGRRAHAAE